MAKRIQLRRDTEANWTSANPILGDGEFAITKDTTPKKIKIGDGATAWSSLPYLTTTLGNSGATAGTYAGRLSVTVSATGVITAISKIAEEPTTLNIPGGSGYASSGKICGVSRTLPTVNVKFRNNDGTACTPSAATTIVVSKTVSGTTTTVATISGLTVADTVYSLGTAATIEAGARVTAAFSGSNNGVVFADIEMVWEVA